MFTVPPGGDGLYYFSTYLLVDNDDYIGYRYFNIVVNEVTVCSAWGDKSNNKGSANPQATCSAVVDVVEGRLSFIFQEMNIQSCFDLLVTCQSLLSGLPWLGINV